MRVPVDDDVDGAPRPGCSRSCASRGSSLPIGLGVPGLRSTTRPRTRTQSVSPYPVNGITVGTSPRRQPSTLAPAVQARPRCGRASATRCLSSLAIFSVCHGMTHGSAPRTDGIESARPVATRHAPHVTRVDVRRPRDDTSALTRTDSETPIRNEPVQARSTARLAALLDAAAHVIDEIGYERLTTAMVAERAGASIGTVYRYFPDRIAVLQSLAARNAERVDASASSPSSPTVARTLASASSRRRRVQSLFRSEPGFARPALRRRARPPTVRRSADAASRPRRAAAGAPRRALRPEATAPSSRSRSRSRPTIADAIAADAFAARPAGRPAFHRRMPLRRGGYLGALPGRLARLPVERRSTAAQRDARGPELTRESNCGVSEVPGRLSTRCMPTRSGRR